LFFVKAIAVVVLSIGVAGPLGVTADAVTPPVLIGLVEAGGPGGDTVAQGAADALRRFNSTGGVDGRPLRLIRLAAPEPWRDGATRIAELVFRHDLTALIGPADRGGAHVAAQIATRKRIPLIVLSPEGALTRVKAPWIFRGVPDDTEQARALLRWAGREEPTRSALIAVPGDRAGRGRSTALARVCDERGVEVAAVIEPGRTDLSSLPRSDLLLLWLGPAGALDLLRDLERLGRTPRRVLGSTRLDVAGFPGSIPRGIESFALPRLRSADDGGADSADLLGRLAHDAVWAVVAAARRYGTTPGAIRSGLLDIGAIAGWSGEFGFDSTGNRVGEIPIGILRDGRLLPHRAKGVAQPAPVHGTAGWPGPESRAKLKRTVVRKRG